MATQLGLFAGLGKYEAELIDDATQRQASSADVGTGWAAMTNAAGRAGDRFLGIKRLNLRIKHLIGLDLNGTQDKRTCTSDKRYAE